MSQRLHHVLSHTDLPLPELFAARLDGELFRVDHCFAPIDEIEQPAHRAASLRAGNPDRVIAEQRSAAWIWGALDTPPAQHELCVATGARVRAPARGWVHMREVVIEASEIAVLDDMQVTTPLRTAVDLARFSVEFGEGEKSIVVSLMTQFGFGIIDCIDDMNRRRNLPNKRKAIARLARCVGDF